MATNEANLCIFMILDKLVGLKSTEETYKKFGAIRTHAKFLKKQAVKLTVV